MKKLLFIANHAVPAELAEEYNVVTLSDQHKSLWGNIPMSGVRKHIAPIVELASEFEAVVVVGEPRACYHMATAIGAERCFSTYSARDSVDEPQPDGSVIKKAIFRFQGLVPYAE